MTNHPMTPERSVAELSRYALVALIASAVVFLLGIVGLLLYFQPSLVGVSRESESEYRGKIVWLVAGIGFLVFGSLFVYISQQWPRRLQWILRTQSPQSVRLRIEIQEDSDSTQYYAVVVPVSAGGNGAPAWRIALWAAPASLRQRLGRTYDARAYYDPLTGRPAVIDYEHGYLWAMKGSGEVTAEG